ncbi:MAG: hypothetical protein ABI844_02020 [Saprospiraceae bacterium]
MSLSETIIQKRQKKWNIFIFIISLLLIVRLILPYVLLHYSNKTLAALHGYFGHIHDLDLSIYRGAYIIKDFYIDKIDSSTQQRTPSISSQTINLSLEWKSLFHRRFVGELEFLNPVMRFTKEKAEPAAMQKETQTIFVKYLKHLCRLKLIALKFSTAKYNILTQPLYPK